MIKSDKWWLLLISLVVFGLALVACQPPTLEPAKEVASPPAEVSPTEVPPTAAPATEAPPDATPVPIALFHPLLGNTNTQAVGDGVADSAAKLGGTVEVFGAAPPFDAPSQSNQIQDAIVSGN